jgi:hypothetical protein
VRPPSLSPRDHTPRRGRRKGSGRTPSSRDARRGSRRQRDPLRDRDRALRPPPTR